ncbi:hypothetical protein B0H16DRAFT_1765640 [Mycena metata]|uniref:Uncharacterized protein n=1 Tax=Mycena metata TaxID=1033252 RepID=A0AAD7MWG2_9AGAR|nr:hypothetical protein B0H16DRAFT_1765640 [Mycena metata]
MNLLYIIEHTKVRWQADTASLTAQAISHLQHLHDPMLESRFYAAAGTAFGPQPNSQHLKFLEKALTLSRSIGDCEGQYLAIIYIANFRWRIGDCKSALAIGKEAHQLAYQTTDLYQVSRAMRIIALSLTALGDYTGSVTQLTRARELFSLCRITSGQLHHNILNSQAEIHLQKSEYAEARSIYTMSIQDNLVDPSSLLCGLTLLNLSLISVLIGATDTVHHTLDRAQEVFTGTKHQLGTMYCTMILADLNLTEENKASTKTQFQDHLKSAWDTDTQAVAYCLERLADISRWPIELKHVTWPVLYLCHAHMSKRKLAFYKALLFIGDLFIDVDEVTAESLFLVALEGFTFMDVHRSRAQCMLRLGDIVQKRGKMTKAAELWTSARSLFERSLQAKDIAAIDMRLVTLEQGHKMTLAQLAVLHAPSTGMNMDKETFSSEVVSSKAYETREQSNILLLMNILPLSLFVIGRNSSLLSVFPSSSLSSMMRGGALLHAPRLLTRLPRSRVRHTRCPGAAAAGSASGANTGGACTPVPEPVDVDETTPRIILIRPFMLAPLPFHALTNKLTDNELVMFWLWLWLWLFGLALASEKIKPGQGQIVGSGLAWPEAMAFGREISLALALALMSPRPSQSQLEPKPAKAKAKPEHHYKEQAQMLTALAAAGFFS